MSNEGWLCPRCGNSTQCLSNQNKTLKAWIDQAIERLEDMLIGDDGQAWVEARKFIDRYTEGNNNA